MTENNVFPEEQETLFSTESISLQELEERKEMTGKYDPYERVAPGPGIC